MTTTTRVMRNKPVISARRAPMLRKGRTRSAKPDQLKKRSRTETRAMRGRRRTMGKRTRRMTRRRLSRMGLRRTARRRQRKMTMATRNRKRRMRARARMVAMTPARSLRRARRRETQSAGTGEAVSHRARFWTSRAKSESFLLCPLIYFIYIVLTGYDY